MPIPFNNPLGRGDVVFENSEETFLHFIKLTYKMKKVLRVILEITISLRFLRLIKVKAYTRIRNGKPEKVRSYYRQLSQQMK